MKKHKQKEGAVLSPSLLANPKYNGKHLIVVGGKVFTATTGTQAAKLFERLTKKYPHQKPTLAYVPGEDTLILCW